MNGAKPTIRRVPATLLLLCAVVALATGAAGRAWASSVSDEKASKVKAAYLFNVLKFTRWPEGAFANDEAPLVVGVVGQSQTARVFAQAVRGRSVQGRAVVSVQLVLPQPSPDEKQASETSASITASTPLDARPPSSGRDTEGGRPSGFAVNTAATLAAGADSLADAGDDADDEEAGDSVEDGNGGSDSRADRIARERLRRCHVVFVAESEAAQLQRVRRLVDGADILLTGESEAFVVSGGHVGFVVDRESQRVVLEVNLEELRETGLRISSELLKVARIRQTRPSDEGETTQSASVASVNRTPDAEGGAP